MKPFILAVFVFIGVIAAAQRKGFNSPFRTDLQLLVKGNISERQLNKFRQQYDSLLSPSILSNGQYPLASFIDDSLYLQNIDYLLSSDNALKKVLGYWLVSGTGDSSRSQYLLKEINKGNDERAVKWAGITLLHLKSKYTTALFDFLVKYEDFNDAHLIPLFMTLDEDSLRETAYRRIHSDRTEAKILAVQIFIVTGRNPQTDRFIKEAINDWPMTIKGYAILPAAKLGVGGLLPYLKPIIDSVAVREVALLALANSSDNTDREFVYTLGKSCDTINPDVMDALFKSSRLENVELWLKLLKKNQGEKPYVFFVSEQPSLMGNALLNTLHNALQEITDSEILYQLIPALQGHTDPTSLKLLINFMDRENKSVRYWAAHTLQFSNNILTDAIRKKINIILTED